MLHSDKWITPDQPDKVVNTCKDCQWWQRITDPEQSEFDIPNPPHNIKMFGACKNPSFIYVKDFEHTYAPDALIYWDFESYEAAFMTGENFGCIHFTVRDTMSR